MKEQEFEDKYLDPEYIRMRFCELKDVRAGRICVEVRRSDNYPSSDSIYVSFCKDNIKQRVMRISSHVAGYRHSQFIVTPGKPLKHNKKEQFNRLLEKCISKYNMTVLRQTLKTI